MAGHSRWANVKHRKARADAKKGRAFTKAVKAIASAARRGGGDPAGNPELRLAIEKGKAANLPQENIDRAIAKATGTLEGVSYEAFTYEGYGPGGVAILLEGATDNRNRTVADLRHTFSKHGGNMGEAGCVAWMFDAKGFLVIDATRVESTDAAMEIALEAGAEDFEVEGDIITVTTPPDAFVRVRDAFVKAGVEEFISDELTRVPQSTMSLPLEQARSTLALLELFEEYDDVENVYSNLELSEEVATALQQES